ncbi:MAG: glutamate synthase subunit beta [Acidobacteriota bacterium]|nr:MAG: glutamate synthase subunit beta [Acidobacteriota bacterium]
MGKPTGFMEYKRKVPSSKDPSERIDSWEEFVEPLNEEALQQQGARCMDCGIPFCHVGGDIDGEEVGCPIHNLIPEWNDLVFRRQWREAYERLSKTNNFPEFTGRVCPAPCEGSCVLGISEPPVTIKSIECAIIDRAFSEGWVAPAPPKIRTGKKVAIVGSGPAGLACADQLNHAGHEVTVFERDDRIGGLLMYGIPNMKLDKELVKRRVDLMAAEGVKFLAGTEVGRDVSGEELLANFDAAVLCGGATKPRDLSIEGRGLKGIHFAMEYLRGSTKSYLDSRFEDGNFISAAGKDVIVIGGGDTGTDCVASATRQKCRSLIQFEILPQPPDARTPENPWPFWPRILRTDYGQEEVGAVFGKDPREFAIMTTRFEGNEAGQVKALHTVHVKWVAVDGRLQPEAIPGTERIYNADLVLLSMGFLGPEDLLLDQIGVERDRRSNARAEFGDYATSIPRVFAAGDMRRGQSLIVWAIREGRGAAREVDRFLMGTTALP